MDGMSAPDAPREPAAYPGWGYAEGPALEYGVPPPPPPRRRRPVLAVFVGLLIAAGSVAVSVGVGALIDRGTGDYAFLMTQPQDADSPVTYDPCSTIEVVVNPDRAPNDWEELVETTFEHVAEPSGLRFELVGETSERPSPARLLKDRERYGRGWSPVLVAWSDSAETPRLAGDTVGLGGSAPQPIGGRFYWVTGSVTLDVNGFDRMDRDQQQAVLDHEFAHVVGLDHVGDPSQLMFAQNYGRKDFGSGDLAGLEQLGGGPCARGDQS